jgi:O-antigen/teichoic acid export membrane protein
MAARLFDAAFALVYLRLLGQAGVGAYAFLVVFTTYLDTLIDFGLNALVAREVARGAVAAQQAFRAVNLVRLGLWLVGLPLVALVYGVFGEGLKLTPEAEVAGWIFYAALLPSVVAKTASGLLWATERLDLTAAVSVIATLLRTALGGVVLFGGFGLIGLASASLAINVVTAIVLWRLAQPQTSSTDEHTDQTANAGSTHPGAWLRASWPLFLNQLLQGLFFKVDSLLLPGLAGLAAAGVYAAAYKVSEGAGIISSSFTLALFPRLARGDHLEAAYRLALRVLLQLAFPLAAGITVLSEPIVAVVGGPEYLPDSAVALAILICYLPLSYANGLTQYLLIAAGRQRTLTGAFLAALVFNLVANALLIPRFSYVGAAWVTVASEVVLLIPFQRVATSVAPGVSVLREARTPILATLLMVPVMWWLRDAIHPLAAVAAGALIYPVALWSLGGIAPEQLRLLRQLLPTPSPSGRGLG